MPSRYQILLRKVKANVTRSEQSEVVASLNLAITSHASEQGCLKEVKESQDSQAALEWICDSLTNVADRALINEAKRCYEKNRMRIARRQAPVLSGELGVIAKRNYDERAERELADLLSASLTAEEKQVVDLKIAKMTHGEIAEELGVSKRSIDGASQRIREKLKARFHDYFR